MEEGREDEIVDAGEHQRLQHRPRVAEDGVRVADLEVLERELHHEMPEPTVHGCCYNKGRSRAATPRHPPSGALARATPYMVHCPPPGRARSADSTESALDGVVPASKNRARE